MTAVDAERILELGSATVHESCAGANALPARIRPAWPGAAVVGPAYPVLAAPGDNLAMHWALENAAPGDVLVVDAHHGEYGHWGEVMAVMAQARGIAGLVIAGGVRDVDAQCDLGFPVFSSSVTVRGTVKNWSGVQGEPIMIGGVRVARGDLVVADADGVVVVTQAKIQVTLRRAEARVAKERIIMRALRDGGSTLDLYDLREVDEPCRA